MLRLLCDYRHYLFSHAYIICFLTSYHHAACMNEGMCLWIVMVEGCEHLVRQQNMLLVQRRSRGACQQPHVGLEPSKQHRFAQVLGQVPVHVVGVGARAAWKRCICTEALQIYRNVVHVQKRCVRTYDRTKASWGGCRERCTCIQNVLHASCA